MAKYRPEYHRKAPRFAYIRSLLPLVILLLLFSILLSSVALLSHFRSPAAKQQLGWQSWDIVDVSVLKAQETVSAGDTPADEDGDILDGWTPSIPLNEWDPLAFHTTGLTEIAVKDCYFPPYMFPSYCAPASTPEEDKLKGKWVAIPKDLNLRSGLWYLNVYYRRTRRLDVPLITDLRVTSSKDTEIAVGGWTPAAGDLHSGVWPNQAPMTLWYKTRPQNRMAGADEDEGDYHRQAINTDKEGYITELDILYGDGDPFYGFQRVQGGKVLEAKEGKWESVDLTYSRGVSKAPKGTVPHFHANGTLKIMQIADLHYSVGHGECRDTDKSPCVGDPDTAAWLEIALDAEKPDLVVFSGDQLNGQKTSYDARSVLSKFVKPVIDRGIPWTAIFGNHDSEIADDRKIQMKTMMNMPHSLAQQGPANVDGVGNYHIELHSRDPSHMHLFTLYFLDSHSYQPNSLPWKQADYDYLKESQIQWYLNISSSIKPISRPFHPDTGSDLGHIWRRSRPSRLVPRQQTLAKPNAIMWFHIPLPEADAEADISYSGDGEGNLTVGAAWEGSGASKHNGGFFYNAIKQGLEREASSDESWGGGTEQSVAEVKVLSHGHSHNTDVCKRVDGIWMCFDGGSSYSGYGKLGFDRRVRIYQLSEYGETVETYKRLTSGDIIDRQVLVGQGAAAGVGVGSG